MGIWISFAPSPNTKFVSLFSCILSVRKLKLTESEIDFRHYDEVKYEFLFIKESIIIRRNSKLFLGCDLKDWRKYNEELYHGKITVNVYNPTLYWQ